MLKTGLSTQDWEQYFNSNPPAVLNQGFRPPYKFVTVTFEKVYAVKDAKR